MILAWLKESPRKEHPLHRDRTTTTEKDSSSAKKTTGVYSIVEDYWQKVLKNSMILEEPTNLTFKLPRIPAVAEV